MILFRLAASLLVLSLGVSANTYAQSLRIRSSALNQTKKVTSPWSPSLRYSVLTDYAEDAKPRGYTQSIGLGTGYKFNDHWSVSTEVSLRAQTFNGQIDKGVEQSSTEAVNPSTALEVDYSRPFLRRHRLTFFAHGEPLWDQPSRIEGYKGLVGGGASITLNFFGNRFRQSHVLDATELLNTFKYAEDTTANPDMFYTYKIVNSLSVYRKLRLSYSWGIKLTRYTDAFVGYSYSNTISLSTSWNAIGFALAYDNGGYTDNGDVSLWYLDQYRRVALAMVNYAF